MIITAGLYKGRKVKSVPTNDVRPTSSKVRESIFNIIQSSIADSVMLDLFAGSGIMGIEAASRGTKRVIFVEKSSRVVKNLRENLSNFDFNYEIIYSDAFQSLSRFNEKSFDIIFLDPPYNSNMLELVLTKIKNKSLLKPNGLVILEHPSTLEISIEDYSEYFQPVKEKKYGDTTVTIFTEAANQD